MPTAPKRLKVALLLYSMTGGGAERVAAHLLETLSKEYNVHLVLFNGPVDYPLPPNIPVHYLRREPRLRLLRLLGLVLVYWRYRRFCRQQDIRISFSLDNLANYLNAALRFDSRWKGRIVLSERNPPSVQFRDSGLTHRLHRNLIRRLYGKSHGIITCSKGVHFDLMQHFGLPETLLNQIYNPINLEKIGNTTPETNHQTIGRFVFIHVGSFRSQKNHRLLLQAFSRLADPSCELWLVGKGPLEQELRELAVELNLTDRVRFLGFHPTPFALMKQADCLVSSSWFEGFPNVLLEALACDLPVISTDCRYGPREILAPGTDFQKQITSGVETGEHGLLVPVAEVAELTEAFRLIRSDSGLRQKFRENARQRVQEFDREIIGAQFAGYLQTVAARTDA